jgi:hypothetical protein
MLECSFELNGKPMSVLEVNNRRFAAFSGLGAHANRREYACHASVGPIPHGVYYVLDRQSGGLLGYMRDIFSDKSDWFALYAADGKIDDEIFCNKIRRGNFRLHPKGSLGISQGCITIDKRSDFYLLRTVLKASSQVAIPGTLLKAYGRVTVK